MSNKEKYTFVFGSLLFTFVFVLGHSSASAALQLCSILHSKIKHLIKTTYAMASIHTIPSNTSPGACATRKLSHTRRLATASLDTCHLPVSCYQVRCWKWDFKFSSFSKFKKLQNVLLSRRTVRVIA